MIGEENGVADPPADHLVANWALEGALTLLVVRTILYPANSLGIITWCGPGMFYPGSGSDHFLIPDADLNIFSSRIVHDKWNANLLFSWLLMLSGAKS
jgi:hypothetical protein